MKCTCVCSSLLNKYSFLEASIASGCLRMQPHSPRDGEGMCAHVHRGVCLETCNHSPIHGLVLKQI